MISSFLATAVGVDLAKTALAKSTAKTVRLCLMAVATFFPTEHMGEHAGH